MKRSGPIRRKTRMKRQSTKREKSMRLYTKMRREFLGQFPRCGACETLGARRQRDATQIHHVRGRVAGMLTDARYFLPVCAPCHRYIHAHGAEARELGLIQ